MVWLMICSENGGRGGDRKSHQRVQREPSDFAKAKETADISDTVPLWFALVGFLLPYAKHCLNSATSYEALEISASTLLVDVKLTVS